MAHITRTVPEVFTVNDSDLRPYLAAGWRLVTADEYAVWARTGGRGAKRAPHAPALGAAVEKADASSTPARPPVNEARPARKG